MNSGHNTALTSGHSNGKLS